MVATTSDAHAEIASQVAIRLVLIVAVAAFVTWRLLPWNSLLSFPLVLVVDLAALWLAVHHVFAALDELLEAKFAELDRAPDRTTDATSTNRESGSAPRQWSRPSEDSDDS